MTRILVGVDGSSGGARALAWAVDEARIRNAPIVVVYAWTMPMPVVGAAGVGMVPSPDADREALEGAAKAILEKALEAVPDDVRAEPVAVESPPSSALVSRAEAGDLIVVGTRGHGDLASLVLGSVSHDIVRHAPCAVVVVPDR
jgi:nucleotide-binding universal stress UspA family protein